MKTSTHLIVASEEIEDVKYWRPVSVIVVPDAFSSFSFMQVSPIELKDSLSRIVP